MSPSSAASPTRTARIGRSPGRDNAPAGAPLPTGTLAARRTGEYGAEALIVCDALVRVFRAGGVEVQALQGLDLLVGAGEVLAIVGASGSGKSTLLGILSGLDAPTAGRARLDGHDLSALRGAELVRYRRSSVGFVRQQSARNLLPALTAAENVALPLALAGRGRRERAARAHELLGMLGLAEKADRRPAALSGGEQQRVSIAVALAGSPRVLLADEPTGQLDARTGDEVFAALRAVNESLGCTILIVTHDPTVAGQVQRAVAIRDGRISSETLRRDELDASGGTTTSEEEFAVLDRVGRLQLPAEYRDALKLEDRVRLTLEGDHVGVWPERREIDPAADSAPEEPPR
ncbi:MULTISPECIES: ABC transporter ATP-binding protein [unclassified Rathayibacter]|uniref:ABC transporter ATP-binding protein n=1 Tax=unclassified Rathayibacter TaxID=2609250 RepID=UPI000F4C25C1|nr:MULTISPECIES: ABC transporter ATP-binding protein [unclassified Rathayibacter]ROP45190.1 ABC-type lipoprotein export system ATPase subunit [Rathayibacter sp. PhB186]ROS47772.1 ABC-type lipoprotein export system ATPase subunit [Rathayibacter sp. PhB185]